MKAFAIVAVAALASHISASPIENAIERRVVTQLDQAAFTEAQQRDDTATRAFTSTQIRTTSGQCLSIDQLSGDFRANLTPVQAKSCDQGDKGQRWDVITAGKHNDAPGTMLVVSALTNACLNFDPRRAAGNTVILFSCGGRADGGKSLPTPLTTSQMLMSMGRAGGLVTNSQQFNFTGGAGPLVFSPLNAAGTCLAATTKGVLDQAPCDNGDDTQQFSFDAGSGSGLGSNGTATAPASVTVPLSTPTPKATSGAGASCTAAALKVTRMAHLKRAVLG